jgi:hypothetical protein
LVALFAAAGFADTLVGGGKFGHGFVSAGLGSATLLVPGTQDPANGIVRTVVASIVGGTSSRISGGKFANGAATAAFASIFSEVVSSWAADSSRTRPENYTRDDFGAEPSDPQAVYDDALSVSKDNPYIQAPEGLSVEFIDKYGVGTCASSTYDAVRGVNSYVLNNPLSYTDPSGHFVFTLGAIAVTAFKTLSTSQLVALFAAAGFADTLVAGGSFDQALKNGIISGVSAGAFSAAGAATNFNTFGDGVLRVGSFGAVGGIASVMAGGKFGHGFVSAGLGAASQVVPGTGQGAPGGHIKRAVVASIVGGTSSQPQPTPRRAHEL